MKRIGIYYQCSTSWIGGKYYLDSIIGALTENKDIEIVKIKRTFFSRCLNFLMRKVDHLLKTHLSKKLNLRQSERMNLDVIFPYMENGLFAKKNISWIPDFQENYLPGMFSIDDISDRMITQVKTAYSKNILIVSSNSAKKDFERLFPKHYCIVKVLPFASSLLNVKNLDEIECDSSKYKIKNPFFICSNQLWKHKNHIVLIKAIEKLRTESTDVFCVITGKEEDYRNPDYPDKLKSYVAEHNLSENVKFLGFISRNDQVGLMKKSVAVIQPSLFEGWNTTVEDAKVLGKKIIVSDIDVHREQLGEKGYYFKPTSVDQLCEKIKEILKENNTEKVDYHYKDFQKLFVENVQNIFLT